MIAGRGDGPAVGPGPPCGGGSLRPWSSCPWLGGGACRVTRQVPVIVYRPNAGARDGSSLVVVGVDGSASPLQPSAPPWRRPLYGEQTSTPFSSGPAHGARPRPAGTRCGIPSPRLGPRPSGRLPTSSRAPRSRIRTRASCARSSTVWARRERDQAVWPVPADGGRIPRPGWDGKAAARVGEPGLDQPCVVSVAVV